MTDWLLYKWNWKGQSAEFRVDMQYWNLLPVLSCTRLLFVRISPHGDHFHQREHYQFNQLRKKLLDRLTGKAIYVGGVSVTNERVLYFYTDDPSLLRDAAGICHTYNGLTTHCEIAAEKDFATYYRFLYPDDAKLQSVENEAFLNSLRLRAEEVRLIHRIGLTASFLSEDDRSAFLSVLSDCGFIEGHSFTGESETHPYCSKVYGYSALTLEALNILTTRLIRMIAPSEGMLTGLEIR